jgi:glycosyltransferase involved in cell wall biosynthesis
MRIALLVPGGVDRTGTERVIPCLLWLIEGLVAAGHEVVVFAVRQERLPAQWKLLGARVHNIGRRPGVPRMLAALLAEHRKARFDAIHAFWAQGCGVAGGIAGRVLGIRSVLTLPGGDLEALRDIGYGGRLTLRGRFEGWLATRLADKVTAPSNHLCDRAARLGISATFLPLGVALDHWPPRPPRAREPSAPIALLHVASLNRVKDQSMLLLAMQALSASGQPFVLTIIGEDTLDGRIQRLTTTLGIDAFVRFIGFVPHHDLRAWVDRADLLVMTSRHEAGPLVMLEAAIAGVPTIGTEVGHIADFAPTAAVAIGVGDHDALAANIRHLAQDEALRLSIASEAQRRALAYDANRTVRELCALYIDGQGEISA